MPPSVLIVEDDSDFAESVTLNLAQAGFTVLGPVTTGVSAFRVLEHERADAALVDIRLAGDLDGVFLGAQLAERGVAVIYLTGHFDRALAEGRDHAAALLAKPVDADDLIATLTRIAGTAA